MWAVVYIAPSRKIAEEIQDLLEREGVLVKLRGLGFDQDENSFIEILVPEAEAGEALELLNAIG